jgi:hypothetical protein
VEHLGSFPAASRINQNSASICDDQTERRIVGQICRRTLPLFANEGVDAIRDLNGIKRKRWPGPEEKEHCNGSRDNSQASNLSCLIDPLTRSGKSAPVTSPTELIFALLMRTCRPSDPWPHLIVVKLVRFDLGLLPSLIYEELPFTTDH